MSNKATFRSMAGGEVREIEVTSNGKSLGEAVKELGIDVGSYQFRIGQTAATAETMVKPGDEVKAAPKVNGA